MTEKQNKKKSLKIVSCGDCVCNETSHYNNLIVAANC